MAHALKHAQSNARKFGGRAEDYPPIHNASIQTTLNTYGGGMMDSMPEAHGRVVKQAMAR